MNRLKMLAAAFILGFVALAFSPSVKADGWDKLTIVTFSEPIEIPGGIILPPGTYVFRLKDSIVDRHIVQILNKDQTHIFATILTVPNYRLKVTDRMVMTFRERSVGSPEAIRTWFYRQDYIGEEFVYPKKRAVELAKVAEVPVLAMPTEMGTFVTSPATSPDEEPVVALQKAPISAVMPTGDEVEVAEVVGTAPPESATPASAKKTTHLPKTASSLPLLGLFGLLSLAAGFAIWVKVKRT